MTRKPIVDMSSLEEVSGKLWNSPRPSTPEAEKVWTHLEIALANRKLRAVLDFARQAIDLAGEIN